MSKQIIYLNDNHAVVKPEEACWKVVHEYNAKGELVKEVWVDLKR